MNRALMYHSNTERLAGYWLQRRIGARAPCRDSIDPCDLAELLPQVFMLARPAPDRFAFRLAGGMIERLHGRPLRHADFLALWSEADRARLSRTVAGAMNRGQPLLVQALGRTDEGRSAEFEILLAPLADRSGKIDRVIGLYQAVSPLSALLDRPLERLSVLEIAPLALKAQRPDASAASGA
jgi:hypothetical protein